MQHNNYEMYPNTYEIPSMEESHLVEDNNELVRELFRQMYELRASFNNWKSRQQNDKQLG